jgi:predicted ATPase
MISQIGLRNVRLFGNVGYNFDLPPLTIFCGTNSSGKSTILKSFLLLRQSQGLREVYGTRPGILRLTGSQVDLGNYQSFVTDRKYNRNVEISLAIKDTMPRGMAETLARPKKLDLRLQETDSDIDYVLKAAFTFKASKRAIDTDEAGRISALNPQGILYRVIFELSVNQLVIATWSLRATWMRKGGIVYTLSIPASEIRGWGKGFRKLKRGISKKDGNLQLRTRLQGLLPSYAYVVSTGESVYKTHPEELQLPTHIQGSLMDFTTALIRIHYLAPLRTTAKRYYLTDYDVPFDLDPRGDFMPYVLGGAIEEPRVSNVLPKTKTVRRHRLSEALDIWLYYFRTGKRFNRKSTRTEFAVTTSKGSLVEIELKALKGALKHSIADSGFGYSQVLPILVRGLIAPRNSTIIIEQPELHLNPALQVRIADFLISLARAGKQVIVETHSEHIVNAVRVRAAKESDSFLSNNSKIYFIDIKRGSPVIHNMNIEPDGTVPGWPFDFFGEAAELTGELLRAQKARK